MSTRFASIVILLMLLIAGRVAAQSGADHQLAQEYFINGEFDKAAPLYQTLFDKNPASGYYYRQYLICLVKLMEFDDAEKLVKKQIKKNDDQPGFVIDLGYVYKQAGKPDDAEDQFFSVIRKLEANENTIRQAAATFMNYQLYDYAIETYKEGNELLKSERKFSMELAQLYEAVNDARNAMTSWLDYLESRPEELQNVKNILARQIGKQAFVAELKTQLYERIQDNEDDVFYAELLIWLFLQKKDFASAFIQVKALDKRLKENGYRVMDFARTAFGEKFYDEAINAYDYVIAKGKEGAYYLAARQEQLNALKSKITLTTDHTADDIGKLKNQFEEFLTTFGMTRLTVQTMRDLASLNAFYLHDLDRADSLLTRIIRMPGVDKNFIAECKLDLGDYLLMQNNVWDAMLLYSQVDLDFKDGIAGELARFKNAKLSYYHGDFEWAQTQLGALKASTSELISNDAINLSVFITDNLGLDTTTVPLALFARADLLIYQNKFDDAALRFDSIINLFPGHMLLDDILMAKARIAEHLRDFNTAAAFYEEVIARYEKDLNGDDALFRLAELNESRFSNPERALALYEQLLTNHTDSVYAVEARKRYRILRGDDIETIEEFISNP